MGRRYEGILGWFGLSVGDPDLLGVGERGRALRRGRSAAILSIVPSLPAPKALSFLHALSLFDWCEFGQGDGIHIHSIRIMVRARWEMCLGGNSSLMQREDAHLLSVEDLSLIGPPFDCSREGRHGEDHTGDLLV